MWVNVHTNVLPCCTVALAVLGTLMVQSRALALAGQTGNAQVETTPSAGVARPAQCEAGSANNDDARNIESARQCIREHRDKRALSILRGVLRRDPSNRDARLEMALILSYREDFRNSDRMYRNLLTENPADEAASLGLIYNLVREHRLEEARAELQRAITHNPNSIQLQQYSDQLDPRHGMTDSRQNSRLAINVGGAYFSDSAGNRSLEATQGVGYQITRLVASRLRTNEQWLWDGSGSKAQVLAGTGEFEFRATNYLSLQAGGGAVRFADQSTASLYNGDLELRPYRKLVLAGGYSRFPISPTFDSAQFDLLAEGWHAGLDWYPKFVRIRGSFSRSHYSDGNRAEKERAEIIHWTSGSRFAFGTGYEFSHTHFLIDMNHGYFSPDQYRSHLAEVGIRFRVGKAFRAEYLGRGGAESISKGSFTPAGELRLRNRISIQQWELGLDYSRLHVAQNTGAFRANSASVVLGYQF